MKPQLGQHPLPRRKRQHSGHGLISTTAVVSQLTHQGGAVVCANHRAGPPLKRFQK